MPLSFVKNIARKVKAIMLDESKSVEFKRVNIPKKAVDEEKVLEYVKKGITDIKEMKDVNFRPLGVPTHA